MQCASGVAAQRRDAAYDWPVKIVKKPRPRRASRDAAVRAGGGVTPTASASAVARPAQKSSVRIIAGAWRGRRIEFPDLPGLRPTPDRIRETLFNWLQDSVGGARCLDLFAGSGALGLEALSRGARQAVFVEQAVAAARGLKGQLARLGVAAPAGQVAEMGAKRYLGTPGEPFDLVFLDPPFGMGALTEYLPLLATGNGAAGSWIKPGGLIYLECERAAGVPALPADWELLKSKSAGEVGYHLARAKVLIREP
jgi:16S rRNA (guanine966-N2)-methyltransferase